MKTIYTPVERKDLSGRKTITHEPVLDLSLTREQLVQKYKEQIIAINSRSFDEDYSFIAKDEMKGIYSGIVSSLMVFALKRLQKIYKRLQTK